MKIKSVKVKKATKDATKKSAAADEPVMEMDTEPQSEPVEPAAKEMVQEPASKKKIKKVKNAETKKSAAADEPVMEMETELQSEPVEPASKKKVKKDKNAATKKSAAAEEPAIEMETELQSEPVEAAAKENVQEPASKKKIKKVKNAETKKSAAAEEPAMEMETELQSESVEPASKKKIKKNKNAETKDTEEDKENDPENNAAPKKKIKKDKNAETNDTEEDKEDDTENNASKTEGKECSIFIGNLPPTVKKTELKALFNKFGTIKTTRFRTNDGQKIFFKKEKIKCPSLNAYVRFSTKEEMEKACEMNGQMVGEHRIRVCPEGKKQIGDVRSTVFVGNIKRGTTENELYDFFGQIGPIEFIRLLPLKFIAYVCFKKGVSMKRVLKLDQQKLNNRPLRIQLVDTKRTNVKLNKKGNLVKRRKVPSKLQEPPSGDAAKTNGSNDGKAEGDFLGNVSETVHKKKSKRSKTGAGSVKHKKMLAKKLKAAMNLQ